MELRILYRCLFWSSIIISIVSAQFVLNHKHNDQPNIRVDSPHKTDKPYATMPKRNRKIEPLKPGPPDTSTHKSASNSESDHSNAHSRQKRMIWITDDGRLALPPGTVLSFSPTISLPLVRYPPSGFLSNMTMSFPLTIDFDKLGLTDNENPLGVLPPVFGRSMGRAAGSMLAQYVGQYLHIRRKRDTTATDIPELPEDQKHVFHGGERAILYGVLEDMIATFGFNGKACLLRTICEVHSKSVHHLGLFGEIAKLFFTASKSKFSDMLPEYVRAEKVGEGSQGPGECFPYYKECPRSLFKEPSNRYSEQAEEPSPQPASESEDVTDLNAEPIIHLLSNEINEINNLDDSTSNSFQM